VFLKSYLARENKKLRLSVQFTIIERRGIFLFSENPIMLIGLVVRMRLALLGSLDKSIKAI